MGSGSGVGLAIKSDKPVYWLQLCEPYTIAYNS